MSRMTIDLTCDDLTYEQIIKQLNRSVEVIKVIDFTDMPITKKELLILSRLITVRKPINKKSFVLLKPLIS